MEDGDSRHILGLLDNPELPSDDLHVCRPDQEDVHGAADVPTSSNTEGLKNTGEEENQMLNAESVAPGVYNTIGAPSTDSGYASMGRSERTDKDEDQDDTRTVCTDNQELNVPEDLKGKLVAAFSGDLIRQVQGVLGKRGTKTTFQNALGGFLKDFSLRLSLGACAGQQKQATTFVRHYRQ